MKQLAQYTDDDIDEEKAIEKYLCVVPKKYSQVAIAIETLLDFFELMIEDVTGRLKSIDHCEHLPPSELATIGGKLLFIEEQWRSCEKERKKGEAFGSSSGRKRGPRKRDKGPLVRGGAPDGYDGGCKATRDDTCKNYGRTSHWAKHCWQERLGGQAHIAQAQEGDKQALFSIHENIELHSSPVPATTMLLHLDEPWAHVFLGTRNSDDKIDGWYINTSTMHHMTGRREFFSEFDSAFEASSSSGMPLPWRSRASAPSSSPPRPASTGYSPASTTFPC
jgi:hypothetical protein